LSANNVNNYTIANKALSAYASISHNLCKGKASAHLEITSEFWQKARAGASNMFSGWSAYSTGWNGTRRGAHPTQRLPLRWLCTYNCAKFRIV